MNRPTELLKEAVDLSGAAGHTQAVLMGLQELIRKKKIEQLRKL